MDDGSLRVIGLVAGAILAVPIALVVLLPLVVTFLGWLVRVPWAFLREIVA